MAWRLRAGIPARMRGFIFAWVSGGVVAALLDHRLQAQKPPASWVAKGAHAKHGPNEWNVMGSGGDFDSRYGGWFAPGNPLSRR